jgi:hypothetical protein
MRLSAERRHLLTGHRRLSQPATPRTRGVGLPEDRQGVRAGFAALGMLMIEVMFTVRETWVKIAFAMVQMAPFVVGAAPLGVPERGAMGWLHSEWLGGTSMLLVAHRAAHE